VKIEVVKLEETEKIKDKGRAYVKMKLEEEEKKK